MIINAYAGNASANAFAHHPPHSHVIFPEKGYAFPGALIFGTDSHTVTNSALGCLATGLGHSDIASYLALGYNWLRVPEVIRFNLHGDFKRGVCAKDIALRIAQLYGEDAAPYLGVEFSGPLVAKLPMSERLVLCNMFPASTLTKRQGTLSRSTFFSVRR